MYSNKNIKDYINIYKGIKRILAKICIKMNAPVCRILNEELAVIKADLDHSAKGIENVAENIRVINSQLNGYEKVVENVRFLNKQLDGYENVIANLRCNNLELEKINSTMDMYGVKILEMEKIKRQKLLHHSDDKKDDNLTDHPTVSSAYHEIDYFDFENYFRGSREQVKRNQSIYIQYFQNKKHVIDLGCGRGEFLELLAEEGIGSYGVDIYQEFVDLCNMKHLKAVRGDAVAVLEKEDSVDGIFAGQLIEHLALHQLIELTETAYKKLLPGSYIVLETPNPMSLAIYTNAFYIDPSHKKPVHPLTIKYLLEKAGFREIRIVFTETSKVPIKIPRLAADNIENIEEFHKAMQEVERLLFGSQDYAVIAKR